MSRINTILSSLPAKSLDDNKINNSILEPSKEEVFLSYLKSYYKEQPSFYYSIIPSILEKNKSYKSKTKVYCFDGKNLLSDLSPSLKSFTYEIIQIGERSTQIEQTILTSLLNGIYKIIYFSHIIFICLLFTIGYLIWNTKKFLLKKDKKITAIFLVLWIGISPLLLLPIMHNAYQIRYIHVSNFSTIIIGLYSLINFLESGIATKN